MIIELPYLLLLARVFSETPAQIFSCFEAYKQNATHFKSQVTCFLLRNVVSIYGVRVLPRLRILKGLFVPLEVSCIDIYPGNFRFFSVGFYSRQLNKIQFCLELRFQKKSSVLIVFGCFFWLLKGSVHSKYLRFRRSALRIHSACSVCSHCSSWPSTALNSEWSGARVSLNGPKSSGNGTGPGKEGAYRV